MTVFNIYLVFYSFLCYRTHTLKIKEANMVKKAAAAPKPSSPGSASGDEKPVVSKKAKKENVS